MTEDIRWQRGTDDGERMTYIESLEAQLERKNAWITKAKWAEIERMLPSITEEEAEKMCFWIRDEIHAEIEYFHRRYD